MASNNGQSLTSQTAPARWGSFLSEWYGIVVILLAITLCTASFVWTLAESTTRAYHLTGEAARLAHIIHTEYSISFLIFAVVSALLIYWRKRQMGEGSIGLLFVQSCALTVLGFVIEMSALMMIGSVMHSLRHK